MLLSDGFEPAASVLGVDTPPKGTRGSSETVEPIYKTAGRNVTEDGNLIKHCSDHRRNGGGGGMQLRPWVLGTALYTGLKLERQGRLV
jgi:hypothetical protein